MGGSAKNSDVWMIVGEVADLLNVSKMTVYRMIAVGEFPAYKFGRAFRVKREDMEQYIQNSKIQVKAE